MSHFLCFVAGLFMCLSFASGTRGYVPLAIFAATGGALSLLAARYFYRLEES